MHRNAPDKSFWLLVKVGGKKDCWPFLGGRSKKGYGWMRYKGNVDLSHRVAFRLAIQEPGDKCVLHKCDNPPCCNPKHLFLGTRRDNVDDRHKKGRDNAPRGVDHHDARLSPLDIIAIRASKEMGVSLAKKFGVTPQHICRIKKRKTWKHI